MPEYERIDQNVHSYESIVAEDIWVYDVVSQVGVHNLTAETYMEQIYTQKLGDKPWYICIIAKDHVMEAHSNFLMKSLYFLQRDFPEKANYAFINANDEIIREAFDYEVIPQCIYVKDGKPYYAGADVLGINVIQEFMIRHEELKKNAIPYLMPTPSAITIYP